MDYVNFLPGMKDGDLPAPMPIGRYHDVYLIKESTAQNSGNNSRANPAFILKQLKLGTLRAFLTGELLTAGEKNFQPEKSNIIPSIVALPSGGNYFWFRGNRFLLTTWLKGREADYHRTRDLQAAIRTMKIFHWFTRNLIIDNPHRWSLLKFDLRGEWRNRMGEMAVCRKMARLMKNDWSRQYLTDWPEFNDQAWEAVQEADNLADNSNAAASNGEAVICYHDWAYHNVIIDDNSKAFLIDFDEIIVDRPVHDRANLINRYLRLNGWSEESLSQIISDFNRFYEWQPGELHWLRVYLTFPYEYWMLGRQYFIEKQPWSMKYYQDQWERKIACRIQRRRVLDLIKSLS